MVALARPSSAYALDVRWVPVLSAVALFGLLAPAAFDHVLPSSPSVARLPVGATSMPGTAPPEGASSCSCEIDALPTEPPRPDDTFRAWVSIQLPGSAVDPNTLFNVTAIASGGLGAFRYDWVDSLGSTATGSTATFLAPPSGDLEVGVRASDGYGDSATANATIGVGTAPSIDVAANVAATDVSRPIPITLGVGGSFPPFAIAWQGLPGGALASASLPGPGELDVAAVAAIPGYEWIRATVTDRYGVTATVQAVVAVVHAPPTLLLSAVHGEVDAGSIASLTGLVSAGTPPFSWAAATSLPAFNVTGSTGLVNASEPIVWSGRFRTDGLATIRFEIADAAGLPITANGTIRIFPPLSPALTIETTEPSAHAPLNVSAYLSGGVPPYSYSFSLSDGEVVRAASPSEGPVSWIAYPSAPGYLVVRLLVSDALSGSATLGTTIVVGPAGPLSGPSTPPPVPPTSGRSGGPSAPPGSSASGWTYGLVLGSGLSLAFATGIVLLRRKLRRHRPGSKSPEARAADVVRRLSDGPDGTERSVLTVLAQEEGVGPDELDRTLERLELEGRVHLEPGPDGGSTVRWSGGRDGRTSAPALKEGPGR